MQKREIDRDREIERKREREEEREIERGILRMNHRDMAYLKRLKGISLNMVQLSISVKLFYS